MMTNEDPKQPADSEAAKPESGQASEKAAAGGSGRPQPDAAGLQWYVIQAMTGHENKVQRNIEQSIRASENMEDFFGEVLVVTQDVTEMRNGKRVTTKRKLFAGYVLVEMILNDDTLHFLTNVPDVRSSSFVGPGNKPTPPVGARSRSHPRAHAQDRGEGDPGDPVRGRRFRRGHGRALQRFLGDRQ